MASFMQEGSRSDPWPPWQSGSAGDEEPVRPTESADPYEAAVERLFLLLEENRVEIATLAQAWRHTRRELELTRTELARTQEALAAERRNQRKASA
jgi:hypothetical protein